MEELLRILEKNARMPIEDIAAMLDKTPEEVAAMMDEAAAKGYIRGYETLVDWEQAGVNLVEAVIELRVTPHKRSTIPYISADHLLHSGCLMNKSSGRRRPCKFCNDPCCRFLQGLSHR